jgi:hypothetical protein
MPAVEASGTQTATLDTEHTLSTITTTKVLVLLVDTANLANGETLELRVKTKILSGGTTRLAYLGRFKHAQDSTIKISAPIPSDQEAVFTLKQIGGTGRQFPWKVMSI